MAEFPHIVYINEMGLYTLPAQRARDVLKHVDEIFRIHYFSVILLTGIEPAPPDTDPVFITSTPSLGLRHVDRRHMPPCKEAPP